MASPYYYKDVGGFHSKEEIMFLAGRTVRSFRNEKSEDRLTQLADELLWLLPGGIPWDK